MKDNVILVLMCLHYFPQYVFSSSSHLPSKFIISFFFTAEQYSVVYICITYSLSICQLFHFLAIVNRTALNVAEQLSVEQKLKSFGHMPRNGMDELYDSIIFHFLRILYTGFQSSCNSVQSPLTYVVIVLLIFAILIEV